MLPWIIYGANGYTGSLIAREAVRQGMRPILAGRNAPALGILGDELGLEVRLAALEDSEQLSRILQGSSLVLHCAGPFRQTSSPMANACLKSRVHYLDITGEEDVFHQLASRDAEWRTAGILVLPGCGFDVVPSDCLAAQLKKRLPSATQLTLAFQNHSPMSRGTALTVAEGLARPGLVRKEGKLTPVLPGAKTRSIDFGQGPVPTMLIPWGDVVTAYYSTGIGNIEVYMAAPLGMRIGARISGYMTWVLGSKPIQTWIANRIKAGPAGPTAAQRSAGKSELWGEVRDPDGHCVVSRLQGPEGYNLTVHAALAIVNKVLQVQCPVGFQTPSLAYGADFVLSLPGVTRQDP